MTSKCRMCDCDITADNMPEYKHKMKTIKSCNDCLQKSRVYHSKRKRQKTVFGKCSKCNCDITNDNMPEYKYNIKIIKSCNDCLQKRREIKTNPYDDVHNPNKDRVNKLFTDQILDCGPIDDTIHILTLDGQNRRTCGFLQKIKIKKENICLIEQDEDTAKLHRTAGYECFHGQINKYESDDKTFRAAFFDTCGSVEKQGSQILEICEKITFDNKFTVATTFCKRGRNKFIPEHDKFFDALIELFRKKKYSIVSFYNLSYSGVDDTPKRGSTMCFAYYTFQKS